MAWSSSPVARKAGRDYRLASPGASSTSAPWTISGPRDTLSTMTIPPGARPAAASGSSLAWTSAITQRRLTQFFRS